MSNLLEVCSSNSPASACGLPAYLPNSDSGCIFGFGLCLKCCRFEFSRAFHDGTALNRLYRLTLNFCRSSWASSRFCARGRRTRMRTNARKMDGWMDGCLNKLKRALDQVGARIEFEQKEMSQKMSRPKRNLHRRNGCLVG